MGVKVEQFNLANGDSSWYVVIRHKVVKNKSRRIVRKVGPDKKVALAAAKEIQRRLTCGDFKVEENPSTTITLKDFGEGWLSHIENKVKYSTYLSYRKNLRDHIFLTKVDDNSKAMGDKSLNEISRVDIREIADRKLGEGLDAKTVRNIIATLSSLLSQALEEGKVMGNVALRPGRLLGTNGRDRREDVNPLNREEVALLLETARIHYPRYYPFMLCLARTGMRLGEAAALQWGDIDFNGSFIEVKRNYTRGQITTPKNGKMRRVDMSLQLAETLKALLRQRKEETLGQGWGQVPEWIFCSETGSILNPDNFRGRVFNRCLEKAGIRRVRIHDLRHTFATLLITQRESLAYVRDQLGHSSIQVTVDTYGHLVPGANKAAVDRLDDDRKRHLYDIRSEKGSEPIALSPLFSW